MKRKLPPLSPIYLSLFSFNGFALNGKSYKDRICSSWQLKQKLLVMNSRLTFICIRPTAYKQVYLIKKLLVVSYIYQLIYHNVHIWVHKDDKEYAFVCTLYVIMWEKEKKKMRSIFFFNWWVCSLVGCGEEYILD